MPPAKKPAAKSPAKPSDPDLVLIASLASILNSTGLTEIELDRKGTRVRVSKSVTAVATVAAAAPAPAPAHPHVHAEAAHAAPPPAAKPASADHPGTVKSPMVGTVYRAPAPGSANFIDIGSTVKEGQTLLIIEAMKTMNQIHAPRAGKITHVFVDNGHPVEFGEPLVVIE
jgi:acetyl-CoA carboxylase biotin carboxyl carrier protein